MIPLPVILAEIIMALGGALFGANALALYKTRKMQEPSEEGGDAVEDRPQMPGPRVQARGRVLINMMIGLVVFVWGLATFIVRLRAKA